MIFSVTLGALTPTTSGATKNKKQYENLRDRQKGATAPFTVLMVVYFAFIPTLGTFYSHVGNK